MTAEALAGASVALSRDQLRAIAEGAYSRWDLDVAGFPVAQDRGEIRNASKSQRAGRAPVPVDGARAALRRRLHYDDMPVDGARQSTVTDAELPGPPVWLSLLDRVLAKASAAAKGDAHDGREPLPAFIDSSAPVPFEDLLVPCIEMGRDLVIARSAGGYGRLGEAARAALERDLLKQIAEIAARTLLVEFRAFQAAAQISDPVGDVGKRSAGPRLHYERFVNHMLAGGWAGLFVEYPMLGRLLATSVLNWADAVAEFLDRFERDIPLLRDRFFAGLDGLLELVGVRPGLSDRHDGGRTVMALVFASGAQLVYKPRSLAIDLAYQHFVAWLNDNGSPLQLKSPRVLDRGSYGWVEFIDPEPCRDADETRRLARRLGMLSCIVYALNGVDFHFENVIADGEFPLPVDLETIFHPAPLRAALENDELSGLLRDSVLRTDILPHPVEINGDYVDISAVGHLWGGAQVPDLSRWEHINTDGMRHVRAPVGPSDGAPAPMVNADLAAELGEGFAGMYRLLMRQQEVLADPDGPLAALFAAPSRFLFRATSYYQSLRQRLLHPNHLRSGADFGIQLENLSHKLARTGDEGRLLPLVREEAAAFLNNDVPRFALRGRERTLCSRSEMVPGAVFAESAWTTVQGRLRKLNEGDLGWQVRLIRAALDAQAMRPDVAPAADDGDVLRSDAHRPALTQAELLDSAKAIARTIETAAIRGAHGEPGWLAISFIPRANHFALQAIGLDLYSGRCGLALFYAALESCVPGSGGRAQCHAIIAPVRRWLERATPADVERMGLGGLTGLPSLIYALVRIGRFLGDEDLLVEARRAIHLIDLEQIAADRKFDVLGGVAGALLCLLAYHTETGDGDALALASTCGRQLVAQRQPDHRQTRFRATSGGEHLTGFAHGAAGIAYALLQLYGRTGEEDFRSAALDAIAFEHADLDPIEHNWPDRRMDPSRCADGRRPDFKAAWCTGAPGIGLARMATLSMLDAPDVRLDIEAALATSRLSGMVRRDHVCCGNMAVTETMLEANRVFPGQGWHDLAIRRASQIASRAAQRGGFAVRYPGGLLNPSLFQGAAGVGYQMLRLAHPDRVPSVLLLA